MKSFPIRMAVAMLASLTAPVVGCGADALTPEDDEMPIELRSLHHEGWQSNALTREEERIALQLIDNACGDTWCEGDYDFRFRRLYCDRDTGDCALAVQKLAHEGGPTPPLPRWTLCRSEGFTGFDSLVETTSNGYQFLRRTYYEAISSCMSTFESR